MKTFRSGGTAINSAINIMKPTKAGQIVRFHTPFPDENPNHRFVITDIHFDVSTPRARIQQIGGGTFGQWGDYPVKDLELASVETANLIGIEEIVVTKNGDRKSGIVVNVSEKEANSELKATDDGIETNVIITVKDQHGKEHTGRLYIIPTKMTFLSFL